MKKLVRILLIFTCILLLTPRALAVKGTWENTKDLKVHIPPKDMLTKKMTSAFIEWQRKTDNYFTFQFVNTENSADIEVIFVDSGLPEICMEGNAIGCTEIRVEQNNLGTHIKHAIVYISRKNNNRVMSNNQVYTIMLHEIGHVLGLNHNKNSTSIMYEETNQTMSTKQDIQIFDLDLLYKLYK